MAGRRRLDVEMMRRGLVASRAQAAALIDEGQVLVAGAVAEKPSRLVAPGEPVELHSPPRYVSRGGLKLEAALEAFEVEVRGRRCLDAGSSTGGFTDCLLQHGARRVIALDVGYGQLHPRMRSDPRVITIERRNARDLTELPFAPGLITCDVSFISARKALPPALRLAARDWEALVLVKPQFEAGRSEAPKGVVREAAVHRRVLHEFCAAARGWDARVLGVVDSGLPGPKGNREFIVHLHESQETAEPDDLDRWIDEAVE